MIQALLTAFVVIRWLGAWSLFGRFAGTCLYSILCIFALVTFFTSLINPGSLRALSLLIGDGPGGYGILTAPLFWLLFFILYPLGLVDWLADLRVLNSNEGILFSHQPPTFWDIAALLLLLLMSFFSLRKFWKIITNSG